MLGLAINIMFIPTSSTNGGATMLSTAAYPPELEPLVLVVLQSVLLLFEFASTPVRVSSMAPPVFNKYYSAAIGA